MTTIEMVKKCLENDGCKGCDYGNKKAMLTCKQLMTDTLVALEKQEPKSPISKVHQGANPRIDFFCAVCLRQIYHKKDKYCANCGQAVKWK